MADALGNSIMFIVLPLYVAELPQGLFPLSQSLRAGLLIGIFGIVVTFIEPFAGAIGDRFGNAKLLVVAGLAFMGVVELLFVLTNTYAELLGLRVLQGLGLGLTVPPSLAIITAASERANRGGSMSIYSTSRILGIGVGPLIGGALHTHFGFSINFLLGGGLVVVAALLVLSLVPAEKGKRPPRQRSGMFNRAMLNRSILTVGYAAFVMAASFTLILSLETQFDSRFHQTSFLFSVEFSVLVGALVLSQLPLGKLSDHIGRKPLVIAGLLLLAPTTAFQGTVGSYGPLLLLRTLQGFGVAAVSGPGFALVGDLRVPGSEGRQMSIVTMAYGLGIASGPLLSGLLSPVSFALPFYVVAGLAITATALIWWLAVETTGPWAEPDEGRGG